MTKCKGKEGAGKIMAAKTPHVCKEESGRDNSPATPKKAVTGETGASFFKEVPSEAAAVALIDGKDEGTLNLQKRLAWQWVSSVDGIILNKLVYTLGELEELLNAGDTSYVLVYEPTVELLALAESYQKCGIKFIFTRLWNMGWKEPKLRNIAFLKGNCARDSYLAYFKKKQ